MAMMSTGMYNTNQLNSSKLVNEPIPSARLHQNHPIFVSGMANNVLNSSNPDNSHNIGAPLREVHLDDLQKSNEMSGKMDRQNSFALYGTSKQRQSGSSGATN